MHENREISSTLSANCEGWCEQNYVDYGFGLARNKRLGKIIDAQMHQAQMLHQTSGKPARFFAEFSYQTHKSCSCVAAWWATHNISTRAGTHASWSPR